MEEIVFYNSEGPIQEDKTGAASLAVASSLHSQSLTQAYRYASSHVNGLVITGVNQGDKIFIASKNKALINVYSWGKESPDQKIPIPEQLTCLVLCQNVQLNQSFNVNEEFSLPKFRLPHLLIGGSISGKIYVWELASGLLLTVKEAHYQRVSNLKINNDGSFLISSGKDGRVLIWNILDLIDLSLLNQEKIIKPIHVISDNSLEITDIFINNNIQQDLKLYTCSKDCTIRLYSLIDFKLLTTFVLSSPIESIIVDSADRIIFAGLSNGNIRQINLYEPNPITNILEQKGGYGKIITIPEDMDLTETITYHNGSQISKLALSLDSSLLISGDSNGKIVACDIVSKQVVKEFKESNGKISNIQIFSNFIDSNVTIDNKNQRPIPQLKRELNQSNDQDVLFQIPSEIEEDQFNLNSYLDRVSKESLIFENLSTANSQILIKTGDNDSGKDEEINNLKDQLAKLKTAYKDLRGMYDELYEEHTK